MQKRAAAPFVCLSRSIRLDALLIDTRQQIQNGCWSLRLRLRLHLVFPAAFDGLLRPQPLVRGQGSIFHIQLSRLCRRWSRQKANGDGSAGDQRDQNDPYRGLFIPQDRLDALFDADFAERDRTDRDRLAEAAEREQCMGIGRSAFHVKPRDDL